MKKLLQINPVVRVSTSTGRIMQEIGELAMQNGWESYVAYSKGRDGIRTCASHTIPIGNKWDTWMHGLETRLLIVGPSWIGIGFSDVRFHQAPERDFSGYCSYS